MRVVESGLQKNLVRNSSELSMIVRTPGSGISVGRFEDGKLIDVNNTTDEGPFTPDRTGDLPVGTL